MTSSEEKPRVRRSSGASLGGDQACRLFSALLEIQGQPPGRHRTVNFLPSREDVQAISGQQCIDGVFTSVTVQSPDLRGSGAEVRRVAAAVTEAAG